MGKQGNKIKPSPLPKLGGAKVEEEVFLMLKHSSSSHGELHAGPILKAWARIPFKPING